ncbi:hypothetical protein [Sorangium sp. So ce131]|uniref:hypothetical protein n=1 Tax=Sorangium sp. So ce131 TaxID=3133282 RepID=UPI003F6456C6
MSGDLRIPSQPSRAPRPRPPCRGPRAALLAALALAACGGREVVEDAPAPPSTGIPLAAPNARGAPLDVAPAATTVLPPPLQGPPEFQLPPDPFGAPEMPQDPVPAGSAGGPGVQL